MKSSIKHIILFVFVLVIVQNKGYSQKTDTIYHINGDILTGEFKKMKYGTASWSMDGMGTINVEEVKINAIRSNKVFEIKMKNGLIYFGSFLPSDIDRKIYIISPTGKNLIYLDDIVEIFPLKQNFWSRIEGNFSVGANFSKSSNVGTTSFSGNLDYRKRKSFIELSWDNNNTFQADTLSANKSDIALEWQRLLKKSWSAGLIIGASQNRELGAKLRLNISVLGLKDIFYNNWNRLYVGAGLTMSRETPYDNTSITNDLTGLTQVVWKVYKFSSPKIWVDANINFLPYITDPGRYRGSFNLNPQVSIFSDNFKVGVSFYYNYDSKPPSDGSKTDYGTNLQLSYSLH